MKTACTANNRDTSKNCPYLSKTMTVLHLLHKESQLSNLC